MMYNVGKQLKKLYNSDKFQLVKNISPYLISGDNIFIESRKKPVSDVPEMVKGSILVDGGNFFAEKENADMYLSLLVNLSLWSVTANESSSGKIGHSETERRFVRSVIV